MNDYKIPLRRKFLMYVEGGQPVPPPPPPLVNWLDVTRTDGLAESDRAAIAVFKAARLCENDDYMTTEEAAAITQLPIFKDVTALITWDWSALSGMDNENLYLVFYNCANVNFAQIPQNFADKATDMRQVFALCTKLALTSLPNGFGSVATNMDATFRNCSKLALTSLPTGFGSVATSLSWTFNNCPKLALTSLPNGFGSVATSLYWTFRNCSELALTSLPTGFGSVATNMQYLFDGCTKLALTSLPNGFGSVATNMDYTFENCPKLALTSLPTGFGSVATNMQYLFNGCTNLRGSFDLGNSNFGQNAALFTRAFFGTNITSFSGYFDLSSVNHDTAAAGASFALEQFVPTTCTHVMFVANTLKYSLVNSAANLTNIDTESLLSLAECLSSSASGKTWTVTNAQFDTLMSEMYSETLSYIMYVMTKGWIVESA